MAELEFEQVDRFTAGTVGPPGGRVFYIQAVQGARVVTLKMEKQQVAALADSLDSMLSDLPVPDTGGEVDLDLIEPIVAEWVVGAIGVAFDEDTGRILLVAEPYLDPDDSAPAEDMLATDIDHPAVAGSAGISPDSVRLRLTLGQVAAFVSHARDIVAAGRQPCIFCGQPRDLDGHVCPRMN